MGFDRLHLLAEKKAAVYAVLSGLDEAEAFHLLRRISREICPKKTIAPAPLKDVFHLTKSVWEEVGVMENVDAAPEVAAESPKAGPKPNLFTGLAPSGLTPEKVFALLSKDQYRSAREIAEKIYTNVDHKIQARVGFHLNKLAKDGRIQKQSTGFGRPSLFRAL